jgi:hypothetical protein
MAALAMGTPAMADPPTPLHPDLGLSAAPPAGDVFAQAPAPPTYPPAPPPVYPSAARPSAPPPQSTASLAPNPPPPPASETPPPSPTYVWEPGHWYWNGVQYHWQPGRYIAKPTTTATYTPDTGSNVLRAGCGSVACGAMGPNGREGETRFSA